MLPPCITESVFLLIFLFQSKVKIVLRIEDKKIWNKLLKWQTRLSKQAMFPFFQQEIDKILKILLSAEQLQPKIKE